MSEKLVKVKALVVLRGDGGKRVAVGQTCQVGESAAAILVKNKQAELVKEN